MKLIKQSFNITEQEDFSLVGIKKFIERCGRVCYKSEDKITDNSYEKFVDMLIRKDHTRPLEFGTVYLQYETVKGAINPLDKYYFNHYSKCKTEEGVTKETKKVFVTTNYRVIIENHWEEDLKYLCNPTKYHYKRHTVHFTTSRGIMDEFRTHVSLSHLAESTRYCNYSKDKFENELTFIIPCWLNIPEGKYTNIAKLSNEDGEYKQIMLHENNINGYPLTTTSEGRFLWNCYWDEHDYFDLLEYWKPQQAREVLPLSVKSELISCGFEDAWSNFFYRRCANDAHPMAREIAIPLKEKFKELGYIK